jgi:hypothetical protein
MPRGWSRVFRWVGAWVLLGPMVGCGWLLRDLLLVSQRMTLFWVPFGCGAVCWLVAFLSLRPLQGAYVLGHECTHALWALLTGGRVRRLRWGKSGGEVEVTRPNSLVVLSPYFFPLYAVLWLLGWWVAGHWLDVLRAQFALYFGLGVAYAFHVTWTLVVVRLRQPDLDREGWMFSGVLILLIHGMLASAMMTWLTDSVSAWEAVLAWWARTCAFWRGTVRFVQWAWEGLPGWGQ